MSTEPTTAQGDRARWIALVVLLAATLLDLLDATTVNIAIPTIQRDLATTFTSVQWIAAGYTLPFAVMLITGGRLGDIFGRKRVFLGSMAAFTIASALSGLAVNVDMLITARVLQGVAAALMVPQVLSIMHVSFKPEESGKVFGIFGAVAGIGGVSGPMVGALLVQWNLFGLGWRPIFLINLPICLVALYLGARYIGESKAPDKPKLDLLGVGLIAAALLALLYPLTVGRDLGWPAWTFVLIGGSVVLFAVFIAQQRHRARSVGSPLVALSLFRIRSFSAGIATQLVFGITFGLFSLFGALYMQLGLGWSPLRTALTSLFFGVTMGISAVVGIQKIVPKFGTRTLQAGAVLMVIGLVLYRTFAGELGVGAQWWQLALPLVITGAGLGLIMAPLTQTVMAEVPFQDAGSASGVVNAVNQVGLSTGLALNAVAFFAVIDSLTGSVAARATGQVVITGFQSALWWVIAGAVIVFALLFLLPVKPPNPFAIPAAQSEGEAKAGAGGGIEDSPEWETDAAAV